MDVTSHSITRTLSFLVTTLALCTTRRIPPWGGEY